MGVIAPIRINISNCEGVTLRWYFNGWHTYTFSKKFKLNDEVQTIDTQVTEQFSMISRVEVPTSKKVKYFIEYGEEGMTSVIFEGVKGLMLAETAQIYLNGFWFEIDIERTSHKVRTNNQNSYDIVFRSEIKDGVGFIATLPDPNIILYDQFNASPIDWIIHEEYGGVVSAEEISGDNYVVLTTTAAANSLAYIKKTFNPNFFGTIKITCSVIFTSGNNFKIWLHLTSGAWVYFDIEGTQGEKAYQTTILESAKVDYIMIWGRGGSGANKISYIKIEKI